MSTQWLSSDPGDLVMVLVSTLLVYAVVIVFTRLGGLRSFAKMSGFDFAATVAIGSLLATTIVAPSPTVLQGVVALASLYLIKQSIGWLRPRSSLVRRAVDNEPLLLMDGPQILHQNLLRGEVTINDLRAKLREANVTRLSQVRAVVLETTGDVSVLHSNEDTPVDEFLLEDIRRS